MLLAYISFSDRENRNVSYSDSGYLTIYAVILLLQLFTEAQKETTVAATHGFIVMMAPCLVAEHFNCYV